MEWALSLSVGIEVRSRYGDAGTDRETSSLSSSYSTEWGAIAGGKGEIWIGGSGNRDSYIEFND